MAAISLTREVTCKKKHVLGWLVWQQRAEWTCEKRNWRQIVCSQIQGDQSLRQKVKEAECGLSWGSPTALASWSAPRKWTWLSESQKKTTGRTVFAFLRHRKYKQHDGSLQVLDDHSQGSRNWPIYFCVLYCLEVRSETDIKRNRAPRGVVSPYHTRWWSGTLGVAVIKELKD